AALSSRWWGAAGGAGPSRRLGAGGAWFFFVPCPASYGTDARPARSAGTWAAPAFGYADDPRSRRVLGRVARARLVPRRTDGLSGLQTMRDVGQGPLELPQQNHEAAETPGHGQALDAQAGGA